MINNPDASSASPLNEADISLLDAIDFVAQSWKKLAGAAFVGSLVGFSSWYLVASYQVNINLRNNQDIGIHSIKRLQASLPNLASEILEKDQTPEGKVDLYGSMSSTQFWIKTITPVRSLNKGDIKDLGAELRDVNNPILFLEIKGFGATKASATQNATTITQFLKDGGAYLEIKDLFLSQQSKFLGTLAKIESEIHATQTELEYQKKRLKSLEELGKRFPAESRVSIQALDPKESGAKYLPINTQIIAINTDINRSNELLSRLKNLLTQQNQIKRWLELSAPFIEKSYNGLELIKELLIQEEKFRGEIESVNPIDYIFVDDLRAKLLDIQVKFGWGLMPDGMSIVQKSGMLKATAGGLAAALILMLLFLLGQRVWVNIKSGDKSGFKSDDLKGAPQG